MYSHTSEAVKYFCVLYSRCRTNAIADQKSLTVICCGDSPACQESRVLLMQLVLVVGKRISLVKGTRNQPKVSPPWRQRCSQAVHHFCNLSLNPFRFCKNFQPEVDSPAYYLCPSYIWSFCSLAPFLMTLCLPGQSWVGCMDPRSCALASSQNPVKGLGVALNVGFPE